MAKVFMEKFLLEGTYGLAISLASIAEVGRMTAAQVLVTLLEVQKESRLHRRLGECYTGGERLASKINC